MKNSLVFLNKTRLDLESHTPIRAKIVVISQANDFVEQALVILISSVTMKQGLVLIKE